MNDTPDSSEILKFEDKFNRTRDLSPIEHILLGSSVPFNGFPAYNLDQLTKDFRRQELPRGLFVPRGLSYPVTEEKALKFFKRREDQQELKGVMSFLGDSILDLMDFGDYNPFLKLTGLVHPKTGEVDPAWQISVVNGREDEVEKGEKREQLLSKLSLAPSYQEFFELDRDIDNYGNSTLLLSFKK